MLNSIERWEKAFLTTLVVGSMINILSPTQVQSAGGIEWTCINDGLPNDIQIEALAIDPLNETTIYAAGVGGVYKSTNGGNTWITINNGLPTLQKSQQEAFISLVPVKFTELTIDPANSNNIYVGDDTGRIFKSGNKGDSWVEITKDLPVAPWRQKMNIAIPKGGNSNTIYVGNWHGVYKSTDSGQTWTKISKDPVSDTQINDIVLDSGNKIYIATYKGIYNSSDGGDSWVKSSDQALSRLTISPSNSQIFYGYYYNGMYKSTDGGANWTLKNSGLPNYPYISSIGVHPTNPNIAYIWVGNPWQDPIVKALFKTTDGGDNWTKVTSLSPAASVKEIAIAKNTQYIYTAGIGIYKSTDNDSNWHLINNGLPFYVDINGMAIDNNKSGTIYLANWRGVFKTTDYGVTWTPKNNNLDIKYHHPEQDMQFQAITVDPNNSNIIYLAGYNEFYKGTDGGTGTTNWTSITTGLPKYFNIAKIVVDQNNSNIIYATTPWWGKIYKSTNGGGSWSEIILNVNTNMRNLFIDPNNSNRLYGIGGWDGKLYRSENQGQSWTELQVPDSLQVKTIAFDNNTLYAGGHYRFYQEAIGKIFKSTDNGNTWTKVGDKDIGDLIIHPQFSSLFYAISYDGVIKSIDGGKNWTSVNEGLPDIIKSVTVGTLTILGSVTVGNLLIDSSKPDIFYLGYPPYGIYKGIDTNSPPSPPTIHTPTNNTRTSDNTPLIIGEAQAGSIIFIYEAGNLLGTVTGDSNNQFIFTSGTLTIGPHTLKFIATDPFGTSTPTTITIEIIAGVIPTIDSPSSGATNQASVTITGIAEQGSIVVIYDGSTPIGTTTVTAGIYSHPVVLKDGLHKLYVKSTNINGVIATSNMIELFVDTIAPPPPRISKPIWGEKINNNKPTIKGITISNGKVVIYDNGISIGTVVADSSGNFAVTPQTALSEGIHFITAKVIDSANNISPPSWGVKIIIDLKPVIIHPRGGKTNNGTPTISGTAPPNTTVEIWVGNTNVGDANVSSAGTFTYQITTPLSDGLHIIKAKNLSGSSNEVRLIVESQSPIDKINVEVKQLWREIEHPDENDKVRGIRNRPMDVTIPIKGNPATVTIKIKSTGQVITLVDKGDGTFAGSFTPTSSTEIEITIIDEKGSSTSLPLMKVELIDPAGYVYNAVTNERITGAVVTCYWWDATNTTWVVWDAGKYNQTNPQVTPFSNEFDYSFLVPQGKYYVYATATGYYPYQSQQLEVIDVPIYHDIYMEPIPVLTSIKVLPQAVIMPKGCTYSFTAMGYDQYDREMGYAECNWSTTIGQVNPTSGATTIFTAPNTIGSGIITAGTGSVKSGTATITIRESTIIKLSPSTIYPRRNDKFTIDIIIENVVNLLGAKVVLSFDGNKIRAGTVSGSSFFSQNATLTLFPKIDNTNGLVEINGARMVTSGTIGVTGTGTLYSVSFTSITSDCSGTISIKEVILKDSNLTVISAEGKSSVRIYSRLLGDFGRKTDKTEEIPDEKIDFEDLVLFASYWNTQNLKGDIASTKTTGKAPDFTYEPDGRVDFEDLVYFAAMWNWYHQSGKERVVSSQWKPLTTAVVRLKMIEINNDELEVDIVIENVPDLHAASFKLKFDPNKLEIKTIKNSQAEGKNKDVSETIFLPTPKIDNHNGIIEISMAGLGKRIEEGSVVKLTFKINSANQIPTAISIIKVDLRDTQLNQIPSTIIPLITFPTDLTRAYCYPNPYIPSRHDQKGITFAELTKNVRIRIFSIAGELVYDSGMMELTDTTEYHWKPKDIASGIYIYLITNNEGQKKIGKVGVIR